MFSWYNKKPKEKKKVEKKKIISVWENKKLIKKVIITY